MATRGTQEKYDRHANLLDLRKRLNKNYFVSFILIYYFLFYILITLIILTISSSITAVSIVIGFPSLSHSNPPQTEIIKRKTVISPLLIQYIEKTEVYTDFL